jgi:hypothetical protein
MPAASGEVGRAISRGKTAAFVGSGLVIQGHNTSAQLRLNPVRLLKTGLSSYKIPRVQINQLSGVS